LLLTRPGAADLRVIVTEVVTEVLGVVPPVDGVLTAVPGFNSFRMVEILELLERRVGVEVPAAELVPANLTRIDGLVALAERCHTGAPA
jgi:hypothetical protein